MKLYTIFTDLHFQNTQGKTKTKVKGVSNAKKHKKQCKDNKYN